jgi:hypothetical protein
MKRTAPKLRRLLPIDPDYAPFGWHWLRGLNALAFTIYVPYIVGRGLSVLKAAISFRGSKPFWVAFGEAAGGLHWDLLAAYLIATLLMIVTVAVINLTERLPRRWQLASLGAALLGCAPLIRLIAWQWGVLRGVAHGPVPWITPRSSSIVLESMAFGCLAAVPIYLRRRRQLRIRALRHAKLQRVKAQSQETEARLQSLQAQIEPHFLFNTLAHIVRLHQVDAQRGRQMLRSLADYMRSALPQMRGTGFTLARELALTRSYIEVQQIRMGERLRFQFDVPAALLDARVPAMTVLTLAENAVKHGLGPKAEGGTLRIEASLQGETLEVVVCDDGVGLQLGAGTGHGLSNTQSRLEAAYGSRASLEIGNQPAGGVRAALLLPFAPLAAQAFAP